MAAAFGLGPVAVAGAGSFSSSVSKERSAVLSHDRDILSRDREYYNSKVSTDSQTVRPPSNLTTLQQLYENIGNLYSQAVPAGLQSHLVGGTSHFPSPGTAAGGFNSSKYSQLLAVIEEIGKDIRPTYAGNKSSAERLKRGIVHARILVREVNIEYLKN